MYCCGPTVYDFAHIGNWRTFVFADLVRRTLEFNGYHVTHVMNITDVEDKIIKGVREKKTTLAKFTAPFEAAFLEDLKTLGCHEPHQTPRATTHIAEIIALIEKLIARGVAYKAGDGSVYFSIDKYRGCGCQYGQLLKLNFDELRTSERVSADEYEKESVADFALWKARVPDDGDVAWPSPFGEGRPGWHIECSAMSIKALGETFDLHLGGEDLKFPHHEDEIAQSEGATGKPFVKYWMHGAFLLVEGKKMSKSLGNYFTLRDLLAKGFTGREIRFLLLSAHYRETFNFTLDGLTAAKASLRRIDECVSKIEAKKSPLAKHRNQLPRRSRTSQTSSPTFHPPSLTTSTSPPLGEKFSNGSPKLTHASPIIPLTPADAASALAAWEKVDSVLGIGTKSEAEAPADIVALTEERTAAKKARDFKRADAIRDELKAKGWVIEDTPKGIKLKKL